MKNKTSIYYCTASLVVLLATSSAHADERNLQHVISNDVLLKTEFSWDGKRYTSYPVGLPELTVVKTIIPPYTTLPWHKHPIPLAGYVLSGALKIEKKDKKESVFIKKGEALAEVENEVHRGITGKEPAVLVIFYAGVKGEALSIPYFENK
ncbi:cupin domain-containing protein [Serratia fonticola]|uniref:cupin domain-containing protein n=1 Tax=Serratia fonticola TaxID=47917 RepID=UPI00301BF92A